MDTTTIADKIVSALDSISEVGMLAARHDQLVAACCCQEPASVLGQDTSISLRLWKCAG